MAYLPYQAVRAVSQCFSLRLRGNYGKVDRGCVHIQHGGFLGYRGLRGNNHELWGLGPSEVAGPHRLTPLKSLARYAPPAGASERDGSSSLFPRYWVGHRKDDAHICTPLEAAQTCCVHMPTVGWRRTAVTYAPLQRVHRKIMRSFANPLRRRRKVMRTYALLLDALHWRRRKHIAYICRPLGWRRTLLYISTP